MFGHKTFVDDLGDSLFIQIGPATLWFSGSELADVLVFVDLFDDAVDPAVAQRLFDGAFIVKGRFLRVFLVEDQPDSFDFDIVILGQPLASFASRLDIDLLEITGCGLLHTDYR
ncbi:MAG: hypothetical protein CMJ78_19470 [Planctomycetaceae bacterium]|nr:hypothetical protein [Planctomycetaceae bacterium]